MFNKLRQFREDCLYILRLVLILREGFVDRIYNTHYLVFNLLCVGSLSGQCFNSFVNYVSYSCGRLSRFLDKIVPKPSPLNVDLPLHKVRVRQLCQHLLYGSSNVCAVPAGELIAELLDWLGDSFYPSCYGLRQNLFVNVCKRNMESRSCPSGPNFLGHCSVGRKFPAGLLKKLRERPKPLAHFGGVISSA